MMNLTSPQVIRDLCSQFGFTFKKGLGQNFLTSDAVLGKIADAVDADSGVLEIGPGFGVLTRALAEKVRKVVTIELDDRLLPVLEYTLSDIDNVRVVHGDVMKTDLRRLIESEFPTGHVSVAANLPYYITTPVITRLLEERLPLDSIIVMVQKEVAQRLCAVEGTKDYGAVTLLCRYYTEPEIIARVPSSLFMPPPKVDSAVLRLRVLDEPSVKVLDEKMFFKVVKAAFSQRRKTLLNCLSSAFPVPKENMSSLLTGCGIEPSRRGETLSINEFARVSDALKQKGV